MHIQPITRSKKRTKSAPQRVSETGPVSPEEPNACSWYEIEIYSLRSVVRLAINDI